MAVLPPVLVELTANAGELKAKLAEAQAEIKGFSEQGSSNFQKLAAAGKGIATAIGASAVGIGVLAIHEADEFEGAHARLQTALENTGSSFDAINPKLDAAQKHMEDFGYSNADVQDALAGLTTGLNDPQKALSDLGVVADLAAKQHMSLKDASDAYVRASAGQGRALKVLGVTTEEYKQALADGTLQQLLASRVQGAAEAQAETFHGKLAALEAKVKDWAVAIGLWLIPKIEAMVEWIQKAAEWLGNHQAILIGIATVIGTVVVAALVAWAIAAAQAAVAQALLLAPIILVVAGIAALVAAVVYAYENWQTFHDVVNAVGQWLQNTLWPLMQTVFGDIVAVIQSVVSFVQDNWHYVQDVINAVWLAVSTYWNDAVVPVFTAIVTVVSDTISFFQDHWDQIRAAFQLVWDAVSTYWNATVAPFFTVVQALVSTAVSFVTDQFGAVVGAFQTAWDGVSAVWDAVGAPLFETIKNIIGVQIAAIETIFGQIEGAFQLAWATMQTVWDSGPSQLFETIKNIIGTIRDWANDAKDAIGGLIDKAKGIGNAITNPLGALGVPGLSSIPAFAEGGTVPGPIGHPMLAVVHGGEHVTPADEVGRSVTINFNGPVYDAEGAKRAVQDALGSSA